MFGEVTLKSILFKLLVYSLCTYLAGRFLLLRMDPFDIQKDGKVMKLSLMASAGFILSLLLCRYIPLISEVLWVDSNYYIKLYYVFCCLVYLCLLFPIVEIYIQKIVEISLPKLIFASFIICIIPLIIFWYAEYHINLWNEFSLLSWVEKIVSVCG